LAMFLPERDRLSQSYTELKALIASAFGGRVAEELIFGKENITTGAWNDIKVATNYARRMVTELGFSDSLGRRRYSGDDGEERLGDSVAQGEHVAGQPAALTDQETRRMVEGGEQEARAILTEHLEQLHRLAKALLEYETLSRDEIDKVIRGEPIHRPEPDEPSRSDVPRRTSIPTSGRGGKEPPGGFEPEPQPGS